MTIPETRLPGVLISLVCLMQVVGFVAAAPPDQERIVLRAWGVPAGLSTDIDSQTRLAILAAFQKRFPYIRPVSTTGLQIPGRTMDIVPLMQIAGDIPPDVMYVNFRQSHTYISNKFLYPLDKYVEKTAGVDLPDGHLLDLDDYLARLRTGPNYQSDMAERVPRQCWIVMRRSCPYEEDCPHLRKWGAAPVRDHQHVWCFPQGPLVGALFYRRDMFAEAGLPDRVPEDWDELLEWARVLTNPPENRYGFSIWLAEISYSTMNFLYSMGGRMVDQDADGNWYCVFDSDEAVDAYHFVARLIFEPFENQHGKFNGVVSMGDASGGTIEKAMYFSTIDQRFFSQVDPNLMGFGPVPKGPTGKRGAEFNSRMAGIFAGLDVDDAKREAAWEYIRFYDGPEARRIRARVFVENGHGRFVQPSLLKAAGYDEYVRQVPKQWETAFATAVESGVPEPYGKNCQLVYKYVSQAIDQIRTDPETERAVKAGDHEGAKARIREILEERVRRSNEKMLDIFDPVEHRRRTWVATAVVAGIFIIFVLLFWRVYRTFTAANLEAPIQAAKGRGFSRYKMAYILLFPAIGSIALWNYYPLMRGSVMAFQDYNVRGFSQWTGMDNFASILFDVEFWYALWVSIKYAFLFMIFGFAAPIVLAFLLTEVPRGKLLFRTIYYLPAVLTGVVVIFLWKGFYGEYGMINQVLNFFVAFLNHLPGIQFEEVRIRWLESPRFALFFCLLPTIWAGIGPGCLIYLAALKTIPEELYEAADVDGAGIWQKTFHVAIPSIKALIMISFIGAMIGAVKSGSEFVLAMTGGGPYAPYGETEVIGLHIFWQAFGYLRFGSAVAMAWILGTLLIGFTVLQLQRLSRMEFRTAATDE